MNINYSYWTTMYESSFAQMYIFLVEKYFLQFLLQNCFMVKSNNYIHLGQTTFIHCSRITVVHVHVNIFYLKFTKHATETQNGIKAGSNSNMNDKHAAEYPKAAYLGVN